MILYILILFIILVLIATILYISEQNIPTLTQPISELLKFSKDFTFDEYPNDINIENEFDCNAESLHVCIIGDPQSLFGCKELIVRCQHFKEDTEYHYNETVTIIPKNKNENEGYALPITHLSEDCNPYHGAYVLVALNAQASEYMFICHCKNPGLIGNTHLLGNCTSVFICNSKIDNIDQPLEKINCKCKDDEESSRYIDSKIPICRTLTVQAANEKYSNWTDKINFINTRTISKNVFNKTISDGLNVDILLDPCRNAMDDPTQRIFGASYNLEMQTCITQQNGIPIKNKILNPSKFTNRDTATEMDVAVETIDGFINSEYHKLIRYSDRVAGKRCIVAVKTIVPQIDKNNDIIIALPGRITLHSNGQLYAPAMKNLSLYTGVCANVGFEYACWMRKTNFGNIDASGTILMPLPPAPPIYMLWGTEKWKQAIEMISIHSVGLYKQTTFIRDEFYGIDKSRSYGIQFDIENRELSGVVNFNNYNDYSIHKSALS